MIFKDKIKKQFKKAGWFEGRNVSDKLTSIEEFPDELKSFIISYGGLKVEDCNSNASDVSNILDLSYENYQGHNSVINKELNKKLFVVGYLYPDHYMIFLDGENNLYLIGDYIFKKASSLKEGIENILEDNWENSLEWDSKNKKWFKISS